MEFISYIFATVPFVLAILFGIVFALFLFAAFRNATFGMGAVFALFLFQTLFPNFAGINLGIRLDALDLVTLLLGLVTVFRFVFLSVARHKLSAWYLFVAAVLISLISGMATLGTTGGVAARPYFYGIVTCSYILTFGTDPRLIRQLLTGMVWLSLALLILVVIRWIITYLPIPDLLPEDGKFSSVESSKLRVISSNETMLLAQVIIVGLFYPALLPAFRLLRPLMVVLLMTVVVLQHRSVWVATIAAVAARFALPQAGRKASAQLAAVAVVLAVVAVPLLASGKFAEATADISRSAGRAIALSDTVNFRFDTWRFTVGKWADSGPVGLVVGLPMGTSMDRVILSDSGNYSRVSVSAHNFFVQTLFNTGIFGLASILSVYAYVLVQLYKGLKDSNLGESAGVMFLLVISQLVYYVAYGINYLQFLILGVAAATALTLSAARQAARKSQRFGLQRPHERARPGGLQQRV